MSKLAYHVAHFKSGSVGAIENHNWKKRGTFDKHSNQDIDPSRSHLNVRLVEPKQSLYRDSKKRVSEATGRVTSASNWITEAIVYPPENIQGDMDKCTEYFKSVVEWFNKQFDKDNVLAATIHYDETTPHIHIDVVPMTKDKRLSSKEVFSRKELNQHHTDLAKHLASAGWDIQRGESTKGKNIKSKSVKEFKKAKDMEYEQLCEQHDNLVDMYNDIVDKYKELQTAYEGALESYEELLNIQERVNSLEDIKTRRKAFSSDLVISAEDYEKLVKVAKKDFALEKDNLDLRIGNQRLTEENHRLNQRVRELADQSYGLKKENKDLNREISRLQQLLKDMQLFFKKYLQQFEAWRKQVLEKRRQERQQHKENDLER